MRVSRSESVRVGMWCERVRVKGWEWERKVGEWESDCGNASRTGE